MSNSFLEPIEQLITHNVECTCGKTHRTNLKRLVIEQGAVSRLALLLEEYSDKRLLLVTDSNTKIAVGDRVLAVLGEQGYQISTYSFTNDIVPNESDIGQMMLLVSTDIEVLVAIGSGALQDLLKYVSLKTKLPLVSILTAASSDRYAMPYSYFFDDGKKRTVKSNVPETIIVDLDVIAAAPKHMAPAGAAAVFAKNVALFDWKLSKVIDETIYCEELSEAMLFHIYNFIDSLSGSRPLYSIKTLEMLMKALIFPGLIVSYTDSIYPVFGSETLMSDCILMTDSYSKSLPSEQYIKAVTTANCARIAESIIVSEAPDFAKAKSLLDDYGWVMHNNEINRVYKEDALAVLSRSGGFTRYNEETHTRRLFYLKDRWKEIVEIADVIIPEYTSLMQTLRSCVLPYRFEDLGMSKDQALDSVIWSSELSDRYGLLSLIWEVGEIDSVATALTARMRN